MTFVKQGLSQKDMMINLIRSNPGFTIPSNRPQVLAEFRKLYGGNPSESSYYNAMRTIKLEGANAPNPAQQLVERPGPEAEAEVLAPSPEAATAASSSFVPQSLMETIADIKESCDRAGGLDVAEGVAEMVSRAGGVENFLAACSLLRKISPPAESRSNSRMPTMVRVPQE